MALFVPIREEDSNIHPSVSEIQALEEWQEMGSFEPISTAAVMKRLRLKFSQRPWSETGKLVRACMDKPKTGSTTISKSPITSCLEKLQRAIKDESLFAVMNKLEVISKQKRLYSRVSPDGRTFYITSEMFCIEIQFEADGDVLEVKLIQPGESPQIYEDMLLILRTKNYEAFGEVLEELVNLYQISEKRGTKAKMYLALQSLEKDITSLSLLHRAPNEKRITKILCGKVGYLRPRTGGTPMSLEFYLSPSQILEEQLTPGLQIPGMKAFVTIGGSDVTHRLPIYPLIVDSWTEEDGHPVFLPLNDKLCMKFLACFFLKFHQPFPMSSSSIHQLQELTGITINELNLAPLHELIVQQTLSEKHKDDTTMTNYFFVSLPDCPKHRYYIGHDTGASFPGAMVRKLPFIHPNCVPDMIEVFRHQAAYNTLVSSCISGDTNCEVSSDLLHFEIRPEKASSISVTFQQPGEQNLACVVIEVLSSKEVRCTLRTISEDCDLNISNDFLTRVLKRCMSIPILMRTIFKKALKQKPDETMQGLEELSDQSSPEASESAVSEGSGDSLQSEGTACETWSPSTAESLPESSSQASVSGTTEENSPSVESSDDSTEANTSSSSLLTTFWDRDII